MSKLKVQIKSKVQILNETTFLSLGYSTNRPSSGFLNSFDICLPAQGSTLRDEGRNFAI
jgi:hypothetical protein